MSDSTVTGGTGTTTPAAASPTTGLIVLQPFGSYQAGAMITDASTVTGILASQGPGFVTRVNLPISTAEMGG